MKPSNILWFQGGKDSRGTLKITDFGTAEFTTEETVLRT
jgi:serine/threonine protein kinase